MLRRGGAQQRDAIVKLVVFGLSISSSWGNGHATVWRGLSAAWTRRKHSFVFFEKDVPYYAQHRDLDAPAGGTLVLYESWSDVRARARRALADADVAMVTSFCPDGPAAAAEVLDAPSGLRVFYDLDTPVTLAQLQNGERVGYLPAGGLADFDLVLSFTGGRALDGLRSRLGARRVAPLYGCVDPATHHRVETRPAYRADLSYLGTYAADRQSALERLFIQPARRLRDRRFLIGGALYPDDFPWTPNLFFVRHLPPAEHPAFYSSSGLTLNVTRAAMAAMGYCPSARLFEAAACGVPVVSDAWEGFDNFFEPGREILIAANAEDVVDALEMEGEARARIARAARQRVLDEHTAERRCAELERILGDTFAVDAGGASLAGR